MHEEELNRKAWDAEVERGNQWSRIVDAKTIEKAREGMIETWITPHSLIPSSWIGEIKGKKVLLLASAGGQQTPVLAAAGAEVTSMDISEKMIGQDKTALERYGLEARLIVGDMRRLDMFDEESFDLVLSPHSINFISNPEVLFRQVHRVLKKRGSFLFGSANPVLYLFDEKKMQKKLKIKYTLPFSDEKSKSRKEVERMKKEKDTFEYSHTLGILISSCLEAGFLLQGFYSDSSNEELVDSFIHDSFLAFNYLRL